MKHKVWIVPHSHYDAEVFLVESETLEIGYANLLGALALMRGEPSFKFTLDQTCLIAPFLRAYPEERPFFEEMIAAGRLEIVGGTVIMPDVNMPSGESWIRQVYYGKRYLERELGLDVRTSWTIDTFGRHPQMPQLTVKCGFEQDAFQRLMFKDGPAEFYWQGLDGTRLLCHWMAASYAAFYGAPGNPHEFAKFAAPRLKRLASRATGPHLMAPAGADLTPVEPELLPMIAAYNQSQAEYELEIATAGEFFRAAREAGGIPVWSGDLNPAFQGCFSARIAIKQWNRRLETLLGNAEKFDALAQRLGAASQAEGIDAAWQGVLFNQFHDILCGSHVDAVYHNTLDRFKAALARAEGCLETSLAAIGAQIETRGEGVPLVVFNPLGWERDDIVECAVAFSEATVFELAVLDSSGQTAPSDLLSVERRPDGSIARARLLFIARGVPALGYEVYRIVPSQEAAPETSLSSSHPEGGALRFELDQGWMENEFYRLEFDLWNGAMTSLVEKSSGWEALAEDKRLGNTVVKERDFGNFWQYNGPCKGDEFYPIAQRYPLPELNDPKADFAHTYLGDGNVRQGRAFAEFSIGHPFGSGQYATRVRLYAGLARIDIQTSLVNQDERVRYRAVFPTRLENPQIHYEIPFGAIQRGEGEYPAQNWVDASDEAHGLTLLNRGLPGNNVVEGVMLLSLLKCTALKEGYAEVGGFKLSTPTEEGYEKGVHHVFDYALVPHAGGLDANTATRQGQEFNVPLLAWKAPRQAGQMPAKQSFLQLSGAGVALSALRACPGGMVARVYETQGRAVRGATLSSPWPLQSAEEVNLIEKEPSPLALCAEGLRFDLEPFEIKTFRLNFK